MSFAHAITRAFDSPYYSGTSASVAMEAVSKYDIMLNGRGYLLDLASQDRAQFESVPLLNAMFLQDRGTIPIGEHSLSPHDYWRRSVDDWGLGAGQIHLDHSDSFNNQYRSSKGVDPWTSGHIGLLYDTHLGRTSANTNLQMVVAGADLYLLDDSTLGFTADATTGTWSVTSVTAAGGDAALSSPVSMTTDGHTVWVADGTRVHYSLRGTATYTKFHTVDHVATLVRFAKARLFSANANVLYTHTLTAGTAAATAYVTHANSDWAWTDVAGGNEAIYFSGFSGDKSEIYAATIQADGTALDAPVVAATLPSGEIVQALYSYLGFLLIGTNKGLRLASQGSGGTLLLGGLITMANPPKCFEGQDRFVWFGWTNYDGTSTGLGRADLSKFGSTADALVPAYASDLMATTAGTVTSVVTFQSRRIFCVSGHGFYVENVGTFVPSGTIQSGYMNYALADNKLLIKVLVSTHAGAGSFQAAASVDTGSFQNIGTAQTTSAAVGVAATLMAPQMQGRTYEFQLTINAGASNTATPLVDRWTIMVEPQVERRFFETLPIMLHARMTDRLAGEIFTSPVQERAIILNLCASRQIIPLQDRETTFNVVVDDFTWVPHEGVGSMREQFSWDGTLITKFKLIT